MKVVKHQVSHWFHCPLSPFNFYKEVAVPQTSPKDGRLCNSELLGQLALL